MKGKKKGFTLIEILVVMSIMIVFMSMLLPRIKGYNSKVNEIKAHNIARQVYSASMMNYIKSAGEFDITTIESDIGDLLDILGEGKDMVTISNKDNEKIDFKINIGGEIYKINIKSDGYKVELEKGQVDEEAS